MNYYNEFDPNTAAWLRELIKDKLIPNGEVDERSITDVQPEDLRGFTQCHFFAGIGGWPLALKLACWPEDRPVWTGSCPCQPFSCAGKQRGTEDERHLWPVFRRLIFACRPDDILGEQVASTPVVGKVGQAFDAENPVWLDGISAELEAEGYSCGSIVLGAHSVGAPHIRKRLYWVANTSLGGQRADGGASRQPGHAEQCQQGGGVGDTTPNRREVRSQLHREYDGKGSSEGRNACGMAHSNREQNHAAEQGQCMPGEGLRTCGMADSEHYGHGNQRICETGRRESVCGCEHEWVANPSLGGQRADGSASRELGHAEQCQQGGGVGDTDIDGLQERIRYGSIQPEAMGTVERKTTERGGNVSGMGNTQSCIREIPDREGRGSDIESGRTGRPGFWDDSIWHLCKDGKARRIPSGSQSVLLSLVDELPEGMDAISLASLGFPLAQKVPHRPALLRGYGNAIVPGLAAEFIRAVMDLTNE